MKYLDKVKKSKPKMPEEAAAEMDMEALGGEDVEDMDLAEALTAGAVDAEGASKLSDDELMAEMKKRGLMPKPKMEMEMEPEMESEEDM